MTLNIGWIGCGRHARQMLLPQLGRNNVHLAAICDVDKQVMQAVAGQYGVSHAFGDFRELIAHPGLDAIGMAVGPDVHRAASLEALARGLPVFMEKPPAAGLAGPGRWRRPPNAPVKTGRRRVHETLLHRQPDRPQHLTGGGFGPTIGILGTIHDAAGHNFEGEAD